MNRTYSAPLIDYSTLSIAATYYEGLGYKQATLPWIIGYEAYSFNKSNHMDYEDCYTNGGYLVGSAEQAFVEQMLEGKTFEKHYSITPCFRDDGYNTTHFACFMKLELISQISDRLQAEKLLQQTIDDAVSFFQQFCDVAVVDCEDGTYDINDTKNNIELGSYGIRQFKDIKWVFATGCALPRLSFVRNNQNV